MFKLVHYVAQTIGMRAVGIRLKCLLVFHVIARKLRAGSLVTKNKYITV